MWDMTLVWREFPPQKISVGISASGSHPWKKACSGNNLNQRIDGSKEGNAQSVENLRSLLAFDFPLEGPLHYFPQHPLHRLRVIQIDCFEPSLPQVLGFSPSLTLTVPLMKKAVSLLPHRRRPTPHPSLFTCLTNQNLSHASKLRERGNSVCDD